MIWAAERNREQGLLRTCLANLRRNWIGAVDLVGD
jgi:hypothetical protein